MSLNIRLAQSSDIAQLIAVERSAATLFRQLPQWAFIADAEGMPAERHAEFIARQHQWLAQDGAQIVGFVAVQPHDANWHIAELSVAAAHQRCGIGRQLLTHLIDQARLAGVTQLTLTTFRTVPWNAPYYRSLGFEILATHELSEALRSQMAGEAEHGLPLGSRCAMKFTLS
ncbi:GNAT family N-acetyltransferase [Serratia odorifera]|uniref:GNAT family N-acetyltransferase n=1 Tax=Serratia odorifera TaxID=618 RepID=UPI0018E8BCD8|nr:GNAT family N-acetyltransferase [Serratia odorifera]MBJ2065755.1 GNAT family N-acetyltransferase [Serratia odorifera]